MTRSGSSAISARRRRGPGMLAVAAAAACLFLVVLTLLTVQLRAGHDPALGPVASAAPAGQVAAPQAGHSTRTVVTRTSGGAVVVSRPASQASPAKSQPASAPVTRSSGG